MVEIRILNKKEFKDIASKSRFNALILAKDYYITLILYLIKDIEKLYFKGGTALQKIFLNYSRLSEDIDFTVTENIETIKNKITHILKKSKFFEEITQDKNVEDFLRLVIHYKGFSDEKETIFIDLNKRAKLLLKPKKYKIEHFYSIFIPEFSLNTLTKEELIAEKVSAAIKRNKPRDYFDIYKIIESGFPIDMDLVKKKCEQSNTEFSIIKMFNNAKKLKNRWDKDMLPLLAEEISFQTVMKTLSKYFRLKEEKRKQKELKLLKKPL